MSIFLTATAILIMFQGIEFETNWLTWSLMIAAAVCLSIERGAKSICDCMIKGQVFVEVVKRHREMEKEKLADLKQQN